ncbi:TadA family conjugal transfer-associated ATPase [Microbacterium candidum]|uniref:TadA family conjugal transfer-associated ATPase n=1 Tax=Microbacterium candidum TaxID=3041922 RepID=A0ABT7N2T8_9MICO|nr:TadA family conjugal transfer-associated ATPase [Microbacterium sp. ASV49]MDL9981025.1 TadA family conjugal transfer-associated ATPase [Microbacterium sp. ASV49]
MSAPFVVAPRTASRPSVDVPWLGPSPASPGRVPDDLFPAALGFLPTPRRAVTVDAASATDSPESESGAPEQPGLELRHPSLAPLAAYLDDPEVTDVFVNGSDGLFVDRGRGAEREARWRTSEEEVRALAVALISLGGRHVDDSSPCVDVRLDGGVRVHAVLPPVSANGTLISLRVPRLAQPSLDELERRGMFGPRTRQLLGRLVDERENLLVTGAAGAGKTTLLGALLSAAAPADRIVTVEDVAELRVDHDHHVRLEARQPNLEGVGGIGLARLVREALRMRPDRLVVGECRGEEVRELLSALNTGHDGGAGTVHANGIRDVPARLEALGALAGLDDRALARQVVSGIGQVLHVGRDAAGRRRLVGMGRPVLDGDRLGIEEMACPD